MNTVKDLKNLGALKELYPNYLFGQKALSQIKAWALKQLEYSYNEDAILLASSVTKEALVELTTSILKCYDIS